MLTRLLAANARRRGAVADPWTDDRAPVEWVTDRMILEFAASASETRDEPLLPTAP